MRLPFDLIQKPIEQRIFALTAHIALAAYDALIALNTLVWRNEYNIFRLIELQLRTRILLRSRYVEVLCLSPSLSRLYCVHIFVSHYH